MADLDDDKWFIRTLMLLPGFLSMGIARYVGSMGEIGEFDLTMYSLVLSLVAYVAARISFRIFPSCLRWVRRWALRAPHANASIGKPTTLTLLAATVGAALVLGVGIGWAYESDALLRTLRALPGGYQFTKRSSARPLPFLLSRIRLGQLEEGRPPRLKQREAWLEISLAKDSSEHVTRIAGYAEFFSLEGDKGEIFLSPACVEIDGAWKPHAGPGVLFRDEVATFVAFVDRDHRCPTLWAALAKAPAGPHVPDIGSTVPSATPPSVAAPASPTPQ